MRRHIKMWMFCRSLPLEGLGLEKHSFSSGLLQVTLDPFIIKMGHLSSSLKLSTLLNGQGHQLHVSSVFN